VRVVDATTGRLAPDDATSRELVEEAISYYQLASAAYHDGELHRPVAAPPPAAAPAPSR
jgi:hypothetical protein